MQIRKEVLKDFESFKEFITNGSDEGDYKLSITDKLKKNNTLGSILRCFGDIIVDAAGHPEDIDCCFKYMKSLFEYYLTDIEKNPDEKKELIKSTFDILRLLNEFILDNNYLTDIWGSTIFVLVSNNIIIWKDFDQLHDLNEEQIQCISEVVCKAILYFDDISHNSLVEEILKYSIFKSNKNLFNFAWKSISSIK